MLTSLCIFCATAAWTLHRFLGEPSGFPAVLAFLAGYLTSASIALWVQADALREGRAVPYDFDSLVFLFWPFVAPIYLFRTRGWAALEPIGLFLVLQIGAVLFAALLGYPLSLRS